MTRGFEDRESKYLLPVETETKAVIPYRASESSTERLPKIGSDEDAMATVRAFALMEWVGAPRRRSICQVGTTGRIVSTLRLLPA